MTDFLRLQNISFSYADTDGGTVAVLKNISLTIEKGEYVVIAGANGSGKSTLARIMCGFLPLQSGSISGSAFRSEQFTLPEYAAADLSVPSGLVFQDPKDQITSSIVRRDTAFGPENMHLPPPEIEKRTAEALEMTSLTGSMRQKTVTLSSGQKQRLALSGICALNPQLLVLDEALSMIDPAGRKDIFAFVQQWHSRGGTVIHITHDREAVQQSQRLIFLENGSVVFDGSPASFLARNTFFVPLSPRSLLQNQTAAENSGSGNALVLKNVSYHHAGNKNLFTSFSLSFARATITAVSGASGTGKTTLCELASGLLRPDDGTIFAECRPVLAQQDCANALFEEFAADDVAYGARLQGLSGSALKKRVASAMDDAGVPFAEFADKRISFLSGGQRRKLSISTILALDSSVLLFDEPAAGLDPQSRAALFALFYKLQKDGKTVIFTTHRADEAAAADRHIVLGRSTETGECLILSDSNPHPLPPLHPSAETLHEQFPLQDTAILASFTNAAAGSYTLKNTPVHRLKPLCKYVLLLTLLCTGICLVPLPFLAADCLICLVYACAASYPLKKLFSSFVKIMPWIALFFVFQMMFFPAQTGDILYWQAGFVSITYRKILLGVRTILHYIAVLIPVSVFVSSTEETEIIDGLQTLLKPLTYIKVPTRHVVLTVSIIFRFIPLLMEESASILKAQLIRSGGLLRKTGKNKGLFAQVRLMIPVFVPLIVRTLKRAELLAQALEARYYR